MLRVQLSAALVMAAAFAIDLSQTQQKEVNPIYTGLDQADEASCCCSEEPCKPECQDLCGSDSSDSDDGIQINIENNVGSEKPLTDDVMYVMEAVPDTATPFPSEAVVVDDSVDAQAIADAQAAANARAAAEAKAIADAQAIAEAKAIADAKAAADNAKAVADAKASSDAKTAADKAAADARAAAEAKAFRDAKAAADKLAAEAQAAANARASAEAKAAADKLATDKAAAEKLAADKAAAIKLAADKAAAIKLAADKAAAEKLAADKAAADKITAFWTDINRKTTRYIPEENRNRNGCSNPPRKGQCQIYLNPRYWHWAHRGKCWVLGIEDDAHDLSWA